MAGIGYDPRYALVMLFKGWLIVNAIFWVLVGMGYGAASLLVKHVTSQ